MPESAGFDKTERDIRVLGKGVESLWGVEDFSAYRALIKAVILPQAISVGRALNR
jgi:hypothetical protein